MEDGDPSPIYHIVAICDRCGMEQLLDYSQTQQLSKKQFHQQDIPVHCGEDMRISLLDNQVLPSLDTRMVEHSLIGTIKLHLQNSSGSTELGERFASHYQQLLATYDHDIPGLMIHKFHEYLDQAFHAVSISVSDQEIIRNLASDIITRAVDNAKLRGTSQANGLVLPGSRGSTELEFVCQVCQEIIPVDTKLKQEILSSDEELDLPRHHDQPLGIRIIQDPGVNEPEGSPEQSPAPRSTDFFSTTQVEELDLTSVGIDIGSSTSHLIISRLHLRREVGFLNMTNRYNIVDREILYRSRIINTPLIDSITIDIEKVLDFCRQEYHNVGITPEQIDTGAVIVTGETAKKVNAFEIVARISDEAGKFVSATAGPNLEALLAAMGSGAVQISRDEQITVLNVDVGGGTSNLALVINGKVVATSCINVGGRLLGIDANRVIWRLDEPVRYILDMVGLDYQLGDLITEEHLKLVVDNLATALIEVMQGPATSEIARKLMMTPSIDYNCSPVDRVVFSGGVAEMIYNPSKVSPTAFRDIGDMLASYLAQTDFGSPIIEPPNKIRATVIGVGSYSVAISGSTIFYDETIVFPLTNIPVLVVNASKEDFSRNHVVAEIEQAFAKYDLIEGDEVVALYFTDPIYARDLFIPDFVTAIEEALPRSIAKQQIIILVFSTDIAGTIGRWLKKETGIKDSFICLDEIELQEGDWIDIGYPLGEGDVFPVTVKSLVFS